MIFVIVTHQLKESIKEVEYAWVSNFTLHVFLGLQCSFKSYLTTFWLDFYKTFHIHRKVFLLWLLAFGLFFLTKEGNGL